MKLFICHFSQLVVAQYNPYYGDTMRFSVAGEDIGFNNMSVSEVNLTKCSTFHCSVMYRDPLMQVFVNDVLALNFTVSIVFILLCLTTCSFLLSN